MRITTLIISNNPKGAKDKKRLVAHFTFEDGKKKTVRFGSYNSITYFDNGDVKRRQAYKARHSKLNENWKDITTRGALAYHVLWTVQSNEEVEQRLKRSFKIPNVKVDITKTSSPRTA